MESLNKINGIVEQNQWICFLKTADWMGESGKMTREKRHIN
jgi:hypothetical protein